MSKRDLTLTSSCLLGRCGGTGCGGTALGMAGEEARAWSMASTKEICHVTGQG
jgi:hypothetical protein